MTQLSWSDVLDIGLSELDDQHRQLIELSNGLIQAMVNGAGEEMLDELFTELRNYTMTHFAAEEAYMESIEYPQLSAQKAAHEQLTRDVDAFRIRLLGDDNFSPTEALDFINDWIIKHIMEMDSRIGAFAKSR